jgi:hypothetical protein
MFLQPADRIFIERSYCEMSSGSVKVKSFSAGDKHFVPAGTKNYYAFTGV